MSLKEDIEKYCRMVTTDKILSCKNIKQSIVRFNLDLKRKDIYIDWSKSLFAINFIESLNHVNGEPFVLEMWQKFIITNLFGWHFKNGKRRFNSSYIEVPRKNGKTALAAAIALFGLVADTRADAQVYTCATTRDQANICYKAAKQMARNSWLTDKSEGVIRITQYEMFNVANGYDSANMKALSSDSNTLDGLKPYIAIVDEYHAHKNDEVYNVVKSGMGATDNPLLFTITTAGFNKNSPCYVERKYCLDVIFNKLIDDTFFSMIYTIDDDDDWADLNVWSKANPNINISVKLEFLKSELTAAKSSGTKEINFKTKYLNLWTDTATTWISDESWLMSGCDFDPKSLIGRECFGGLDLSKSQDFSSLCLMFPPINDETDFKCLYYFWLPDDTAKERHKRNYSNLLEWSKNGHIKLTEGNVIDHQIVRNDINILSTEYFIKFINYDRAFATTLVTELLQDDIQMHPFAQGFLSMAAPTSELERMVLNKELNHGNSPVMRWMIGNVLILHDAAGNMKVDKSKPDNKVDGVISNIMAIAAYIQNENERPKERDFFFIKVK